MIAVLLSEMAGWLKNQSRTTLTPMLIVFGIAGSFSFLRPEICLEILIALIIWLATKAGKQSWSEFRAQDWVKRTHLPLRTVVFGKTLAAFGVCLLHLAVVFPVLMIMVTLWGFTWGQLMNMLLLTIITALIGIGLGLCGSSMGEKEEDFRTGVPVALWLIITAIIPMLRPINPFCTAWNVMVSNTGLPLWILTIDLGIAASSVWTAERLFRREAY